MGITIKMVESSGSTLSEKIFELQKLTIGNKGSGNVEQLNLCIAQVLEMLNDNELQKLDNMTTIDYALSIYVHLIESADTVNARFVWKRAPKEKATSKALSQAWNVAKSI